MSLTLILNTFKFILNDLIYCYLVFILNSLNILNSWNNYLTSSLLYVSSLYTSSNIYLVDVSFWPFWLRTLKLRSLIIIKVFLGSPDLTKNCNYLVVSFEIPFTVRMFLMYVLTVSFLFGTSLSVLWSLNLYKKKKFYF